MIAAWKIQGKIGKRTVVKFDETALEMKLKIQLKMHFNVFKNSLASFFNQSNCDHNSLAEDENQQQNDGENNSSCDENIKPSFGFDKV